MKTKTTLSSLYKVTSIQNLRPSRLSTRLLQSKIYDALISLQVQNEKKTILSSQYKVTSIQNLGLSRLSIRSKWKKNGPLISVQGRFESKIYNPLIWIQGQFKVRDPLVSVQGLGLYLYIYFIVFYFHNRTKLVFLSLLIFYSDNLNFIGSDHLVKFK